jgi:hypothetical protein
MAIVPDTKDWTWVLERRCPECGLVASELPTDQIAPLIRANAQAWVDILADDPERLRRRAREDRWSPLQYACHVRDVFRVGHERLNLMVTLHDPHYRNWDQDRTAVEDNYEDQDPKPVAAELSQAADTLAGDFEGVDEAAWQRRGTRSDGASFTVETLGQYLLHDVVHHLDEVTGDLAIPAS